MTSMFGFNNLTDEKLDKKEKAKVNVNYFIYKKFYSEYLQENTERITECLKKFIKDPDCIGSYELLETRLEFVTQYILIKSIKYIKSKTVNELVYEAMSEYI